jgi:hypothetical protein
MKMMEARSVVSSGENEYSLTVLETPSGIILQGWCAV